MHKSWMRAILSIALVAGVGACTSSGGKSADPAKPATSAASSSSVPSSASASASTTAPPSAASSSLCSTADSSGDARLGPARLPVAGDVGAELSGYNRTGGLSVRQFLARYWAQSANAGKGGWRYPPGDGYMIGPNGHPEETQEDLFPGQDIDRFGSAYGAFLSPEGIPYRARSIPPQSLDSTPVADCDYHRYRVIKGFVVDAGPIAPWFGQPGGGWQYQLDPVLVRGGPATLNVMWLVSNGYVRPLASS
jgi:hypothetical protein